MKVVAFHQNQLGDLLFSLPALKALKDQNAVISSVTRPNLAGLLKETSLVDEIIIKEKRGGLFNRLRLIRQLRQQKFEIGLFFSCSEGSLILGYLGGIKERIGFVGRGDFLLTKKVEKQGASSPPTYLRLIEEMGIRPEKRDYVGLVKIPHKEMEFSRRLLGNFGLCNEDKVAIISPFASKRRKFRQWPEERFARLIDLLWERKQIRSLVVGTRKEIEEAEGIRSLCRMSKPLILAGKTNLLQLAALIKLAKIFIGIESGTTHLASSLRVPFIALYGPINPFHIGPQAERGIVIKKEGMGLIEAEEVMAKVEEIA